MTRVDFHFNVADKLGYGCRLVRKVRQAGHRAVVHVSLTDDPPLAQAFVIIEAVPD